MNYEFMSKNLCEINKVKNNSFTFVGNFMQNGV